MYDYTSNTARVNNSFESGIKINDAITSIKKLEYTEATTRMLYSLTPAAFLLVNLVLNLELFKNYGFIAKKTGQTESAASSLQLVSTYRKLLFHCRHCLGNPL